MYGKFQSTKKSFICKSHFNMFLFILYVLDSQDFYFKNNGAVTSSKEEFPTALMESENGFGLCSSTVPSDIIHCMQIHGLLVGKLSRSHLVVLIASHSQSSRSVVFNNTAQKTWQSGFPHLGEILLQHLPSPNVPFSFLTSV